LTKGIGLVAFTLGLATAASASPIVLYSNGLVDSGPLSGYEMDQGQYPTTNSFVIPAETIQQIDLVVYTDFGPLDGATIDWKITSAPFSGSPCCGGTVYASGASPLTGTLINFNDPQSTYLASFDLNVPLSAGTYWFEFDSATAPNAADLWWDTSNGPSQAWQGGTSLSQVTSNSFEILGTPEPASFAICGAGLMLLGGAARRRRA
jgi:hypothetical protein